jgi:hypothetical protein
LVIDSVPVSRPVPHRLMARNSESRYKDAAYRGVMTALVHDTGEVVMSGKAKVSVGFAAVAVVLAAAGCTAGHTGATGSVTPSASAPTSDVPSAPASVPTKSATSVATPVAEPSSQNTQRCHTSDLTGHVEGYGAGMGQRFADLGLTNKTATVCRIYGYPGLQLVDAHGSAMPTTTLRNNAVAPTLLTVKPGQTVWAVLRWTVTPAEDETANHCAPDPMSLRVIPPDETTQLMMTFDYGAICQHGTIMVSPFGYDRPPDG